jgi:hypothetical protein
MNKSVDELLLRQKAAELAEVAIRKAAGPPSSHVVEIPCYLATRYDMLDGLPAGARMCKMPEYVADDLLGLGFYQPVSLKSLPDKWWWIRHDIAYDNPGIEPGGAYVERVVSSEELARIAASCYAEVQSGPFASRDDAQFLYDLEWERDDDDD